MNNESAAESRRFGSSLAWVAVAQGLRFLLVGFATLPALTKSYPPEIYGVWVQTHLMAVLLAPVLSLQLGTAIVRFLAAEDDVQKRRQVLGAMLWPVLAFSSAALLVSFLLRGELSTFLFASPEYALFVPLAILWGAAEGLFFFLIYYLRARDRIKTLALMQIALAVTKMALIVSLATTGHSLETVVVSVTAVQALFAAMALGMIARETGWPRPNLDGLGGFLAFSLPQLPAGVLLWIISASNRYFIAHFVSLSEAGIYSASYTLGSLLSLFFHPINFVLFPALARNWERKEPAKVRSYLEYSTKLFLVLAIPGAAGLFLLSQPLLRILATPEYAVGGWLVLLVALGFGFYGVYQINSYIIYLVKQTKWLPLIIGLAAAANAGINVALLPRIGIMGAAIAAIVSYFLLAGIVTAWARTVVSYKFDWLFLSKVILAAAVMAACVSFIPVSGVLGIVLAVMVGAAVFVAGLLVLRAFSKEEQQLMRGVLSLGSKN